MEMVRGQNQTKTAPKRIEFQEIVDEGGNDRISALSDCLILEILSRLLSTKGAIRTGTLSKRWRDLWTLVPSLYFDEHKDSHFNFVPYVDKTLNQCRQLKLKKFVVYTSYDPRVESQVNSWILYAISRNVEELNLLNLRSKDEFLLDQTFYTSSWFTDLTLKGCILNPVGVISWKNLRSLCISYKKLDEDLIENILSGSPLLETLVLIRCYGYRRLDITSKSVKNLVVSGYMIPNSDDDDDDDDTGDDEEDDEDYDLITIIEINAPNIMSLTIKYDLVLWKLLLLKVSSLVKANLDYANDRLYGITSKESEEEMLKGLIQNLRHVKELKIGVSCSQVLSRLEAQGFVIPSNIKLPDITPPLCPDNDLLEHGDWPDSDSRQIERCSCLTIVLKLMSLID